MKLSRRSFLELSTVGVAATTALTSPAPVLASSSSEESMSKASVGTLVDTTLCIGCRSCFVACKQWNQNPASPVSNPHFRSTNGIDIPLLDSKTFTNIRATSVDTGKGPQWVYAKVQCMHCVKPGCAQACIVGALKKQPNGPVTYDMRKCIGCRYCQVACPFGIPTFQWDKAMPWIRKCTFCVNRQSVGLKPACVTACPTGALKFGNREELLAEAKQRIASAPGKYVNHIYGENEAGGTSWLYIASVPFEKLGFSTLGSAPVTVNVERGMSAVPPVLLGVAATMTGIYWVVKRKQKNGGKQNGEKGKEEVLKK